MPYTNETKSQLLSLIGETDFDDMTAEQLISILKIKLTNRQKRIEELEHANDAEKTHLHHLQEQVEIELHRLHTDPTRSWSSQYALCFQDDQRDSVRYQVTVKYGNVELVRVENGICYVMQQVDL